MYASDTSNGPRTQTGRPITKAYHKKSRNGCQRCRARRVKCDERQPTCGNCSRHSTTCLYLNNAQKQGDKGATTKDAIKTPDILDTTNVCSLTPPGEPESQGSSHSLLNDVSDLQLPESKSRRLLELRLLNYYKDHLVDPLPDLSNSQLVTAWSAHVPEVALQHDNMQYMMFSVAACRLLRSEPGNTELMNAQQVYLALAMREQQTAVAHLSVENCDAVSFTAMSLLITGVARLWRRPTNPYVPPIEFLRLGNGVGAVLETAKEMLKRNKESKMWLFINAPPRFDRTIIFADENQIPFQKLLDPNIHPSNPDIHEAYAKTVAYLGYLHKSVQEDEPLYVLARKIISFSIFVPREFLDFVEKCNARALVILAHYFGFMCKVRSFWWALETPKNEIEAIQEVLPTEWQEYLRWPLMMTGQTLI